MKNRRSIVMATVTAVTAAALCGCPPRPAPPPPAPPAALITIGGDCNIATTPEVWPGRMVRISYFGPCEYMDVDFGGTDLFGIASIRLNHGESCDLSVVSASGKSYALTLSCSCDTGGGHTTPEIKVGTPPPPEP